MSNFPSSSKSKIAFITWTLLCFGCIARAEDALDRHVRVLSVDIGKRNPAYYENLERAADYIRDEFKSYGYEPKEQSYTMKTRRSDSRPYRNIIAVKEGKGGKGGAIIVCAHYDTHRESPGADDNASGVAAVLKLAREMRDEDLNKTVKFIVFTNEELELVSEDMDMGSYRYAENARGSGENIEAVVCVDMIGFFSDEPGSQRSPFPLSLFYPDRGNFIGISCDVMSYGLMRKAVAEFKKASDIPVEYLVIPVPLLPQIMTSDNRPFWIFGYKSIWVTDTCIYRNTYMHTKNDSYRTLDYQRMGRVVNGLRGVISALCR